MGQEVPQTLSDKQWDRLVDAIDDPDQTFTQACTRLVKITQQQRNSDKN